MIKPGSPIADSDYGEGLIHKMTTIRNTFSSEALGARTIFAALALVAAFAAGLMLLMPGSPLYAQDSSISYDENGTGPVATFTSTDPEGRPVYWSLADAGDVSSVEADLENTDIADATHFSISSDGVLSFKFSPDYEMPRGMALDVVDNANSNTYKVVVAASDDALGAGTDDNPIKVAYEKVTVTVTDVDEPGMVTLSAEQPQASVDLTATLTDDDATGDQITAAKWEWEYSTAANGPWTSILTATTGIYPPLGVEDKYLRVTVTYTDEHDSGKTAQAVSANMVRAAPAANNAAPVFPDEDAEDDVIQVGRKVDENSPPGTNVGAPVVANDAVGDVLTYTLTGTIGDVVDYRIDQATGQITVGPRTVLDHEGDGENTVTVTATDPAGGKTDQLVTITINDVNEAPMISEGFTRNSNKAEYDADDGTGDVGVGTAKMVDTYTATDVDDGDTPSWSVSGTDAGDFDIGNEDDTFGALTFKKVPNYEMPADSNGDNVYMVTVVVSDGKLTAMRDVTITITNVKETGTVTLSTEQPKIGIALTATLEDPDGVVAGSVKWQWYEVSSEDIAEDNLTVNAIEDATSDTYTPEATGLLSVRASFTDGSGSDSAKVSAANPVIANTANVAPKFPSSETGMRVVAEGTAATMNINDADDDADADPVAAMDANADANADPALTYTLGGTDAASFGILRESGQLQTKAKLDYETKDSYMVTVTATDSDGLSASIDVTITVTNVDEAPEIAGEDIAEDFRENGRNLEIERFRATDPEGRPVYWSVLPDGAAFNDIDDVDTADAADADQFSISSDGVLSFKFSPDYEMPRGDDASVSNTNTYKVVVVASDDAEGVTGQMMAYRKVTVTVTNMEETETVTLSALQGQVNVELTATYNDLDNEKPAGTNLTWKWYLGRSQIQDAGDEDTGDTSAYTPGVNDSSSLRVEASYTKTDGTAKTVSKTIRVRAVPEAGNVQPKFGEGAGARSVDENSPPGTTVGAPVAATDPGDVLTYTLSGTDAANYEINRATGQITVGPRIMLDHEAGDGEDMVTVTATDPAGPSATPTGAAMQDVVITVKDVNEAPEITDGVTRISRMEDDPDLTADDATTVKDVDTYVATDVDQDTAVVWSVSGTDKGDFEISTAGVLTFKEVPNYEMPADSNGDNVYMVTVVATDAGVDGKNKMAAERAVVVTVTNVDEDGTVTLSTEQPKVGIALTATVEDPDGVVAGSVKWQWYSVDEIDENDLTNDVIEDATSDTYTPEAAGMLSARASYTDGEGAGKSAVGTEANVVMNLANVAPEFASETDARSVLEGTAAAMGIGALVTATDANTDDTLIDILTYTLSGADAASFDIDRTDGQLATKAKLDYESKNSYMVTVTATDSGSLSASIDVTIKVTDVDDPPVIMVGGLAISGPAFEGYEENRTDAVATYTAVGPEAARARWSLEGADAGDFRINGGMLTFRATPDYERPADADTDNVYNVTVKANDGENTAMRVVTITVTNVEELGMLSGDSSVSYPENGTTTVETYTADGPDTTAWSLEGDDAGDFRIAGGMLTFRAIPNFEVPRDANTDNVYMVTVKAAAGGEEDMLAVTITVTDVEEDTVQPGETPLERYDTNKNDRIDKQELVEAIFDYNVLETLEKEDLVDLIFSYEVG